MIINRHIQLLLVLLITLWIFPSQAQEASKNYSNVTDSNTQKLLQSPLLESTYHLAKETSPLLLEQIMGKQISITSLSYQTENGKFRPYQDAEHSKGANFSAQGGKKLPKMLLWGNFSYSNSKLDSIRWGHRKDSEFSTPFYYASQRAVHYQKTDYVIQTHLVHQIISGLSVSLSGDYGMGDHFSTNDPRAVLKHFKLLLTPALQWKNQQIGVELRGLWGYGQQESQVDYRNKEYYESTQYPEYLNWFINGYGTMRNALSFSDRVYTNNQDFSGAGFAFFYKPNRWQGQANINYRRIHEEYDRGNSSGRYDGYDMYGDYNVEQWSGYIEAHDISLRWGFRLQGTKSKGKDYNIDLLGNNYAAISREGTVQVYYSQHIWGRNTQFIFEQKLNYHNQVDGNMLIKRAAGRQSSLLKLHHQLDQRRSRLLELGFGFATPYSTEFNQSPRSSNDFIDQVIKHDVVLDNTSFWHVQSGLQQFFRFTNMNWMARLHTQQFQSNSKSEILSGKSRNQTTLSLNLYF